MNFQESMEYMEQLNERGSVLGLINIQRLLEILENPQNQVPVIHVAGTNGKGSTIAFMESILLEAGFHVGKYISPTVFSYLERFQIDGRYMDEADFAKYLTKVQQAVLQMEASEGLFPTAFEVETAVAFLYCKDKADIMLLETGMGGRLDSTNVVDKPLCTVLASISMDHMQFLGNTIEEIAREKAGILRTGVACISNPANERVEQVLRNACEEVGAVYQTGKAIIQSVDTDGTTFVFQNTQYEIHLLGAYQVDNAVTAIMAVQAAARVLGRPIDEAVIEVGLRKTKWAARLEKISEKPDFYVDGAHNIDACICLRQAVETYFTNRKKIYIIGVLKDKEYEKMMALLAPTADAIFTVTPENSRGLSAEVLADVCGRYCAHTICVGDLAKAVAQAKEFAKPYGEAAVILAFGSLSYIGSIQHESIQTIIDR